MEGTNTETADKDQSNSAIMEYLKSMESRWNKRLDDIEASQKKSLESVIELWTKGLEDMKTSLIEQFNKEIKSTKDELSHDIAQLITRVEAVENSPSDTLTSKLW